MLVNASFGLDRNAAYDRTDTSTLVIDHINGIRWDNRLENLRLIPQRENAALHHHLDLEDIESTISPAILKDIYLSINRADHKKYIDDIYKMLKNSPIWRKKMEDEIVKMNSIKMKDGGRNTKVVTASIDKMTYADAEKQRLEKKMTRSRFYTEALKYYMHFSKEYPYVELPSELVDNWNSIMDNIKHSNGDKEHK